MQLILGIILLLYIIQQIAFVLTIAKIKQKKVASSNNIFVSIIIPIKNEASNIDNILNDFERQSYPTTHFELILVDDNSIDNSFDKVERYRKISKLNIKTLSLTLNEKGKKTAIIKGAKLAKSEWLIITDADTLRSKHFVASTVSFLETNNNLVLCFGNVIMNTGKRFLHNFQHIEYSTLQAVSIASSSLGINVLGSAANMCVKRTVLLQSNLKREYISGDDVFLLQWVKKYYGNKKIGWNYQKESAVKTLPKNTWKEFWQQRLRWVGKSAGYNDLATIIVSLITYLANLSLLLFPFFTSKSIWLFIFVFFKLIVDILLYIIYKNRFLDKALQVSIFHIMLTAIFYPVYLSVLVPASVWFTNKQPR